MHRCDVCGFEAQTPQALGSHRHYRHGGQVPQVVAADVPPLEAAVDATLSELRRMGRLEPVDSARVEVVRQLAVTVQQRPQDARLWRELRMSIAEVVDADDRVDDDLAAALASIGGGPALGNGS